MNKLHPFDTAAYGWAVAQVALAFGTFVPAIIKDPCLKEFRDGLWDPDQEVSAVSKDGVTVTLDRRARALYFECPDEGTAEAIAQKTSAICRKRLVVVPQPEAFFSMVDRRTYTAASAA